MLWFYLFSFVFWTIGFLSSPYPFPSLLCCHFCLFIALFGWFGFAWFLTLITSSCKGDREGVMEGGNLLLLCCCLLCDLTAWERNKKVGGMEMAGCQNPSLLTFLPGFLEITGSSTLLFKPFKGRGWDWVAVVWKGGQREKIVVGFMGWSGFAKASPWLSFFLHDPN